MPNTKKSLNDCTRVRSSGRWLSSTIAEAPTKPKFQPSPSRIRPSVKCGTVIPDRPTTAATLNNVNPAVTTRGAPNRVIRVPVKKLGPYIATTCHCSAVLDAVSGSPHSFIASGAEVMTRFIRL